MPERILDSGLKLNKDKCQSRKESLESLGMVPKNGIRPHSDKIRAIEDLKQPAIIKEDRHVMGIFKSLGRHVPLRIFHIGYPRLSRIMPN